MLITGLIMIKAANTLKLTFGNAIPGYIHVFFTSVKLLQLEDGSIGVLTRPALPNINLLLHGYLQNAFIYI